GVVEHWLRRGAAGVRLDAAADLPLELVTRLRGAAHAVRADAVVLGEIVPRQLERWTTSGALDAATDFAARERLLAWLGGTSGAAAHAEDAAHARFRRGHEPG